MSEYIERAELLRKMDDVIGRAQSLDGDPAVIAAISTTVRNTKRLVKEFPAANVAPVRHAKWVIQLEHDGRSKFLRCTGCNAIENLTDSNYRSPYCPNCGARMDGGGE